MWCVWSRGKHKEPAEKSLGRTSGQSVRGQAEKFKLTPLVLRQVTDDVTHLVRGLHILCVDQNTTQYHINTYTCVSVKNISIQMSFDKQAWTLPATQDSRALCF